MSESTTIELGGEAYLVQREGDIEVGQLPGPAREALERGDHTDQTLQTSLLAVVQAEADRGA